MRIRYPLWCSFILTIFLITATGCGILIPDRQPRPAASPTPSVTPNSAVGGSGVVISPIPTSNQTPTKMPTSTPTPNRTPTQTPTSTPNPTPSTQGPYVVKQTRSLGGETISGEVCSLTDPFQVTVVSPKVTFLFNFIPAAADHGQWTYAYNISQAGETHDAKGNYTIRDAGGDGTLVLSMTGSDGVAFKGFAGPMPISYGFNLVPSLAVSCPKSH